MLFLAPPAPVLTLTEIKVKPGQTLAGKVKIVFPSGYHGYQNPPKSEYENPIRLTFGKSALRFTDVSYPKGMAKTVAGGDSIIYENAISVGYRLVVPKTAKVGRVKVPVKFDYQLCSDTTCLAPETKNLTLVVVVTKP